MLIASVRSRDLVAMAACCLLGACADDTDAEAAALAPERSATGCFDCASTEYCMMVSGDVESFYCAPDTCAGACDCLMAEAARRHAECSSSCQTGSGMVLCAK